MSFLGELLPILLIAAVAVTGFLKGVKLFAAFTIGAKQGLKSAFSILPTLIGIITGITMLSASGALDALASCLKPLCNAVGMPTELLPLAILRPISGSGANAAVVQLFEQFGADSTIGQMASVFASASETTFYAVSVYFAGRSYKNLRYTVPVALFGDFTALALSLLVVKFIPLAA